MKSVYIKPLLKNKLIWIFLILVILALSLTIILIKNNTQQVNKVEQISSNELQASVASSSSSSESIVSSLPSTSSENYDITAYDTSKFTGKNQERNIQIIGYEDKAEITFISWMGTLWIDFWNAYFIDEISNSSHVSVYISLYSPELRINLQKYVPAPAEEKSGSPEGPRISYTYNFETNSISETQYYGSVEVKLDEIPQIRLLEIGQQIKPLVDECLKVYELDEEVDEFNIKRKVTANQLTIEKVKELSKKEDLSWSDFEMYDGIEIGSGLCIVKYPVNNEYYVIVGGKSHLEKPMYIRLVQTSDADKYIDIQHDNIDKFIKKQ